MKYLTSAVMIALVTASVTSCTFNDSQERQWLECQARLCQSLDSGHVEKAEGLLEEELKRIENSSSGPHEKYLESRCLSALGKLYRYDGKADKAIYPLTTLLEIKETIDKKRHLKLAHVLIEIADCYIDQKKYKEAIDYLLRAAVMQQSMSPDTTIACLRKLARAYESLNNKEQAQLFYQLAIDADAGQQSIPEDKRTDLVLFDQANLMWDYSSFLARQNKETQSDALEARADHIFKILVDRSAKVGPDDKYVLGFKPDSDAAKVANLVNVLVEKGNYADAEALLDRFYDISVDLSGFADENSNGQFIIALHRVWCGKKGSIDRTVSSVVDEDALALVPKTAPGKASNEALFTQAQADFNAGRIDDAQVKAATFVLQNYNSRDCLKLLAEIAQSKKRLQEEHELKLRLKQLGN